MEYTHSNFTIHIKPFYSYNLTRVRSHAPKILRREVYLFFDAGFSLFKFKKGETDMG